MKSEKSLKLLIAEDDPTLIFFLKGGLTIYGYEIINVVSTGERLLEELEKEKPDIILLDIGLPGNLDGIQVAEKIQENYDLPIIFLTAYDDNMTIKRALKTEAFAYILKPVSIKELNITIEFSYYKYTVSQKLRVQDKLLGQILNQIKGGVIYADAEGHIRYINIAAEELTGLSSEHIGENILNCLEIHNPATEEISSDLPRRMGGDLPYNSSDNYLLKNAEKKYYAELTVSQFHGAFGEEEGLLIYLRDRTAQWETQRKLEMIAAGLENTHEAVIITTAGLNPQDVTTIYLNHGLEKITGWTKEEIEQQGLKLIFGEKTDPDLFDLISTNLHGTGTFSGDVSIYRKNGKLCSTTWNTYIIENPQGEADFWLHVVKDVTELRVLEENLRESQKIEAVGRLAGGIAHDFNNILSIINSFSDLISLKLPEEDPLQEHVEKIIGAGQRGAGLVAQLMSFSRRDQSSYEGRVNVSQVVRDLQDMIRRLIREDIEMTFSITDAATYVVCDPRKIEQILVNLCVNARDALNHKERGHINLSLESRELEESLNLASSSTILKPGSYVVITVSDNGSGIDKEVQKNIFEPFFTTKDIGEGTGLGLSTVFGIVKQQKGGIQVESAPGKGTTFSIYLPAVEKPGFVEKALNIASIRPKVTETKSGNTQVLVVEDEENIADCIEGLLNIHGYEVLKANNGQEALERYGKIAKNVPILITDMVMPKVSGIELARELLKKNPKMKLIFMSGYTEHQPSPEEFPDDMVILRKPFSLNSLITTINDLVP